MKIRIDNINIFKSGLENIVLDVIKDKYDRTISDKNYYLNISFCFNTPIPIMESIFFERNIFDIDCKRMNTYTYKEMHDKQIMDLDLNNLRLAFSIQKKRIVEIFNNNNIHVVWATINFDNKSEENYIEIDLEDWETAKYKIITFTKEFPIDISSMDFTICVSEFFKENQILFSKDISYELIIHASYNYQGDLNNLENIIHTRLVHIRQTLNSLNIRVNEIFVFGYVTENEPSIYINITQREIEHRIKDYILMDYNILSMLENTYKYEIIDLEANKFFKHNLIRKDSMNHFIYENLRKEKERYKMDEYANESLKDKYRWAVQLVEIDHLRIVYNKAMPMYDYLDTKNTIGYLNTLFDNDELYKKVKILVGDL